MASLGFRQLGRAAALLAAFLAMAASAGPARAIGMAPAPVAAAAGMGTYYQATTIVTGRDMRMRPIGFARCLRAVLVKLTGEPRLERDPRVDAFAKHADAFVDSFDYVDQMAGVPIHDDQGTSDRSYNLIVHFVPEQINRILAKLDMKVWRGARPVIVPVLAITGFDGKRYLLTYETPAGADQREAFAGEAADYGLAVRFPSAADLAAWGVGRNGFPEPKPGDAAPGDAVVAGTLEFHEDLPGWVARFRLRWQGTDYAWGSKGGNYDAAFRDLIRGVLRIAAGHGAPE
ncbi:MAG TPA: DUF2066 domain-containing protein [Alphaproteobacteria bacterium]|nr:DUF2066 domain-containing protein [Alphaproteobacteria bacterium]